MVHPSRPLVIFSVQAQAWSRVNYNRIVLWPYVGKLSMGHLSTCQQIEGRIRRRRKRRRRIGQAYLFKPLLWWELWEQWGVPLSWFHSQPLNTLFTDKSCHYWESFIFLFHDYTSLTTIQTYFIQQCSHLWAKHTIMAVFLTYMNNLFTLSCR